MKEEVWKPVNGYEGLYEVSNMGRVRSLNYSGTGMVQILKQTIAPKGYKYVGLFKNGKQIQYRVHRLVWEAFVGKIPDGYELDHIDTNPTNNCLSNLRCVTHIENMNNPITRQTYLHAIKERSNNREWRKKLSEIQKKRFENPEIREERKQQMKKLWSNQEFRKKNADATRKAIAKSVVQLDKYTGDVIRKWESAYDVERELGIYHSNIAKCCKGKRKSAGGFAWKFA